MKRVVRGLALGLLGVIVCGAIAFHNLTADLRVLDFCQTTILDPLDFHLEWLSFPIADEGQNLARHLEGRTQCYLVLFAGFSLPGALPLVSQDDVEDQHDQAHQDQAN